MKLSKILINSGKIALEIGDGIFSVVGEKAIPWVGCWFSTNSFKEKVECGLYHHKWKTKFEIEGFCEVYSWKTCTKCGYTINNS